MQAQSDQIPVKNGIKRRISLQDANQIAELVAYRLTESEASLQINIQPKQWFDWKCRAKNKSHFDEILTRIRGAKLRGHIREIERAATGADGVRHDWRAADRMMSIQAPERYSAAQQLAATTTNNTAVVVSCGGEEQLRKLVEDTCRRVSELRGGESARQLAEATLIGHDNPTADS